MSFVRRSGERIMDVRKMFDGGGQAKMYRLLNGPEEMCGKGRLFNHVVLEKGCEVGWHVHHGDGEAYYIIKGQGEYNDNGTLTTMGPGDVSFVGDGEGHSIINRDDEPLEMIALILYT